MKTQAPLLLVATVLALTGCEKATEFAAPTEDRNPAFTEQLTGTLTKPDATLETCLDVYTAHTMTGSIRFLNMDTYQVVGRGEVISDPLGAGTTRLSFTYSTKTKTLTGTQSTTFTTGEVLNQTFTGLASQVLDGRIMTLEIGMSSGTVLIKESVYDLTAGNISIVLPLNPSRIFPLSVTTKGRYCTQG